MANPMSTTRKSTFHGIDVECLDQIPEFTTVQAVWQECGTPVEYTVDTLCDPCQAPEKFISW